MGLYCSHDAFCGSYSAFNRMRSHLLTLHGGRYFQKDGVDLWEFDDELVPIKHLLALYIFHCHSDCDGEFSSQACDLVAKYLRWAVSTESEPTTATGHLSRYGATVAAAILNFADGCKRAHEAGEHMTFG